MTVAAPSLAPAGLRCRVLALLFAALAAGARANAADLVGDTVLLQGLDKVTARISTIEAPLGVTVRFGTLEITAHQCRKRPPEETPESMALMEIHDGRPGEARNLLFRGWMMASSPALNALEHPVYDVWVKDCLNVRSPESSGPK
ncbi:MAG: DUF2155 domain-containing protein [Alphaproteobacteria bacterium]|nr:DUF2155 domain-containing protein [Alphaproteobacteria bacterium]